MDICAVEEDLRTIQEQLLIPALNRVSPVSETVTKALESGENNTSLICGAHHLGNIKFG